MSVAWMFSGHGAQYVGMGRAVLRETDAGRTWLGEAERISGLSLGALAAHGPARDLADPRVLEPLLAAIGGAHADALLAEEGPPAAVAAYSAGHVAALYAAGVVDRVTCLAIARARGAELARAAAQIAGGMVAVHGLPEDQLTLIAEDDRLAPASIAAHNAPLHVVYTGPTQALARAAARASAAGAVTAPLDVAGPWHSPLLHETGDAIASAIAALPFAPAQIDVWSSVTALASRDPEQLRHALAASIAAPVEWHATISAMRAAGMKAFVEVSPGRALWGLLGQLPAPRDFSRRYVECARGPGRRRAALSRGGGDQLVPATQEPR